MNANDQRLTPRARHRFQLAMAKADFDFHTLVVELSKPTGRQLLKAGGFVPPEQHLIFQVLDDGTLEERRLDEAVELREEKEERFIVFRSDRSFRVEIGERRFEWGAAELPGSIAKRLVGADPECTGVWLVRPDEPDLFIKDTDVVKLTTAGVEKLRIGPVFPLCIEGNERKWLEPTIVTEQIAELGSWDPSLGVQEVDLVTNEARLSSPKR